MQLLKRWFWRSPALRWTLLHFVGCFPEGSLWFLSPSGQPARTPRARSTRCSPATCYCFIDWEDKKKPGLSAVIALRLPPRLNTRRTSVFAQEQVDGPLLPFRCCWLGRLKVDEGAPRLSDLLLIPDRRGGGGGGVSPRVEAEGAAKPDLMTRLCSAPRLLSGWARARQ